MQTDVWRSLDEAGRRAIFRLLFRAVKNNDKPTYALAGPMSPHVTLRSSKVGRTRHPCFGGEKMSLASVYDTAGLNYDIQLNMTPLSADLLKAGVQYVGMSISDALQHLEGFSAHVERLMLASEDELLEDILVARKDDELRKTREEAEVVAFQSAQGWGDF